MTVMDAVEGWNEEEWVGSRLAACMWICTKAVLCDGQEPTQVVVLVAFATQLNIHEQWNTNCEVP